MDKAIITSKFVITGLMIAIACLIVASASNTHSIHRLQSQVHDLQQDLAQQDDLITSMSPTFLERWKPTDGFKPLVVPLVPPDKSAQ